MRCALVLALAFLPVCASAPVFAAPPCNSGVVFEDVDGDGQRALDEPGIAGAKVSDGVQLVVTGADGRYALPVVDGRSTFLIKPAGYETTSRGNGLPDYWRNVRTMPGPELRYGGIPVQPVACKDFPLRAVEDNVLRNVDPLRVAVFADPQVKSPVDVDYYKRDIIDSLTPADLGITLGDVVDDDLSLYPALNKVTTQTRVPWLHAPGNHDLDFDASRDEDSLLTFRNTFGPDTFAWEERQASFLVLDDVVHKPGQPASYIGGLREDQFGFLEAYLPTIPKDRLLVVAVHIPLFELDGRDTFRDADRERLFALLHDFPHVLLLSGHSHTQQHVFHGAGSGWHGAEPLHEYNVGAACGAFWSGVENEAGIPETTMADGTPNGYAMLTVADSGEYRLAWHPAGLAGESANGSKPAQTEHHAAMTPAMALHAPSVLRQGAYPAAGVYANVFMGLDGTRVEYRIDNGEWQAMRRVERPDPRLLAENVRDDEATELRGYDRAPDAEPSSHLWRGALPTDLLLGEHRIEVRAFDRWLGEQRAGTTYRLAAVAE